MAEPDSLQPLLAEKWNQGLTWTAFLEYATRNVPQMRQSYDQTQIPADLAEKIEALRQPIRLTAIGADWCGDVAANLPAIARLAASDKNIELRVLDRDAHEDLMQHFLTRGGKAIPIVIISGADMAARQTWGPRPAPCQAIMDEHKGKMPKEEILPMLRQWYDRDKNQTLFAEMIGPLTAVGGRES